MLLRTARPDAYTIAASAALALGGFLLLRNGNPNGWWMLLACSGTAALFLIHPHRHAQDRAPDSETIDVTSWGVRRIDHGGLREAVSWGDLTQVSVVTAVDAEDGEDVHVLLRGRADNSVRISHTLAVESGLLATLATRLRAFDNAVMVDALTSRRNGVFVLWRAPTPLARGRKTHRHPAVPLRAAS